MQQQQVIVLPTGLNRGRVDAPLAARVYRVQRHGRTFEWHTDGQGNTRRVSFSGLALGRGPRNSTQQARSSERGHATGHRCFDANAAYDGGHLLASMFGFLSERLNLVPMVRQLNRGNYLVMERFLKANHGNVRRGTVLVEYVAGTACPAFITVSFSLWTILPGGGGGLVPMVFRFVNDPLFNVFGGTDVATLFADDDN